MPIGLGVPPARGIPQGGGVPLPTAPPAYNVVTDPVTPVQVRGHSVATSPMASSPSVRKKEKKEKKDKKGKVKKSVKSPLSVRISTSGAVPPAPAGSAGPSTSPMSPVGCSPRSRSRSPLAPGSDMIKRSCILMSQLIIDEESPLISAFPIRLLERSREPYSSTREKGRVLWMELLNRF